MKQAKLEERETEPGAPPRSVLSERKEGWLGKLKRGSSILWEQYPTLKGGTKR